VTVSVGRAFETLGDVETAVRVYEISRRIRERLANGKGGGKEGAQNVSPGNVSKRQ